MLGNVVYLGMERKEHWIFMAYRDQKYDFPLKPFETKVFDDFDKMKRYSAEHSVLYAKYSFDYCSTYVKCEL